MQLLHICNDYTNSPIYQKLYSNLDNNYNITQLIYVPIRNQSQLGKRELFFKTKNSKLIYSKTYKFHYKILFQRKVQKIYEDIVRKIDINRIQLTSATTLYSDGAVAYKIFKNFGIPYIVFVRMTDVYFFLKYAVYLNSLSIDILINANKIIFLSPSLREKLISNRIFKNYRTELFEKSLILPNGIDNHYISNIICKKHNHNFRLIYVGDFSKNKNVLRLMKAVKIMSLKYPKINLTIVGSRGAQSNKIISLAKKNPDIYNYLGRLDNPDNILEELRKSSIFTMVSHKETFGLVYIEALSQGLPILATKKQGIDGFFNSKIGEFVNSKSTNEIASGIETIFNHYNEYEIPSDLIEQNFNWDSIANHYYSIIKTKNNYEKCESLL